MQLIYAVIILAALFGQLCATNISTCQPLNTSGTYILTSPLTANVTCFNITAVNVTLDCNGYAITGNNAIDQAGIVSAQNNTAIKNCNLRQFHIGIWLQPNKDGSGNDIPGAINGQIETTAISGGAIGIALVWAENTSITNSNASGDIGIALESYTTWTRILNSVIASPSGPAHLVESSHNNSIENTLIYAPNSSAYSAHQSSFNNITNSILAGCSDNGAVNIYGDSHFNWLENNTIDGLGCGVAASFMAGEIAHDNVFKRNTIMNASTLFYSDQGAYNNTFCWNNFTNGSVYFVEVDEDCGWVPCEFPKPGPNYLNSPICNGDGNLWENVLDGTVNITGANISAYSGDFYTGNNGSGYPYSSVTSGGKILLITDYAPLTWAPANCSGNLSLSFQPGMTPDGLFWVALPGVQSAWMQSMLNAAIPTRCMHNMTSYAYIGNHSVFSQLSTTANGSISLNHTGIRLNTMFHIYANATLVNGSTLTTGVRSYEILGYPSQAPRPIISTPLAAFIVLWLLLWYAGKKHGLQTARQQ